VKSIACVSKSRLTKLSFGVDVDVVDEEVDVVDEEVDVVVVVVAQSGTVVPISP